MLLIICSAWGVRAQTQTPKTAEKQKSETALVRGTATIDELSQALYAAIQAGSIGSVDSYFPTEQELAALKEKGSPDMAALLENLNPEQVMTQFKEDYTQMIEESMNRKINWSEAMLSDTKPRRQTNQEDQNLFPVEMVLTNKANQQFNIVFEAVKLNDRYFLFRRLTFA